MSAGARLMVMCGGDVVTAVFQRGADAVAALAHGSVGQSDGVEMILIALDAGAVDFHLNDVGVDPVDGGAESLVEHDNRSRRKSPGAEKRSLGLLL